MNNTKSIKFTTGKARLSYAYLFKVHAREAGDTPKFSCSLIIPKTDAKNIERYKAAMREMVADPGNINKWGTNNAAALKMPLRDGDKEKPDDANYKNSYFINASANAEYPPKVVTFDRQPVEDPSEVYSGCYVQAVLTFFAYNTRGNKGVGVGLRAIRKISDGEPITGGGVTDSDFDDSVLSDKDVNEFLS